MWSAYEMEGGNEGPYSKPSLESDTAGTKCPCMIRVQSQVWATKWARGSSAISDTQRLLLYPKHMLNAFDSTFVVQRVREVHEEIHNTLSPCLRALPEFFDSTRE